jgi:hypothetical protein
MVSWIAASIVFLLALAVPAGAGALADERTFDPHYWSHPRYIDPTYDFEPPPKPEVERATTSETDEEQGRAKRAVTPAPKRDDRTRGSRRRRR